jgi:hypothetical protein
MLILGGHTVHDAGLDDGLRPGVADHLGQALEPVADHEEHVPDAPVAQVGEHAHPELGALPAGASPQAEDVFLPGQGDADGGVDGPVGDLPVPDLHHDGVDEDRRIDLIERPAAPGLHLLDHLVGDPRDRLLAHRRAVDLGEVRADLPGGQALGIQRQHDLIDPGQPPLPLLDDLRLERAMPVARHLDRYLPAGLGQHRLGPGPVPHVPRLVTGRAVLVMTEMPGHLLIQRRLQHRLGQLLQQPVRASQRHALLPGPGHQLLGQLLLRGRLRLVLLPRCHIIQCRGHHGTFPARSSRPARSGRKHR